MTLPKRCWVICCERRQRDSRCSDAAGEMSCAKSVRVGLLWVMDASACRELDESDCLSKRPSGSELNSGTKLTVGNLTMKAAETKLKIRVLHRGFCELGCDLRRNCPLNISFDT